MKIAAKISFITLMILASGFIDHQVIGMPVSHLTQQEMNVHPVAESYSPLFCLFDSHPGDDIIHELPRRISSPEYILVEAVTLPVPAPVIVGLPHCWQPPDFRA